MDLPSPTPSTTPTPRLLPPLQHALSILYALHVPSSSSSRNNGSSSFSLLDSSSVAHDFLLQLQQRNLRRRIQSLQQKHRDQQKQQQNQQQQNQQHDHDDNGGGIMNDYQYSPTTTTTTTTTNMPQDSTATPTPCWTGDDLPVGSSWLALLVLLLACQGQQEHQQHHRHLQQVGGVVGGGGGGISVVFAACWTERLFCAQSLLQRLRRSKLVEAIDWEMEAQENSSSSGAVGCPTSTLSSLHHHQQYFVPAYQRLLERWNPFVAAVLETARATQMTCFQQQLQQQQTSSSSTFSDDHDAQEALIKAEFGLWTLVAVAFQTAMTAAAANTSADAAAAAAASSSPNNNNNNNNNDHHHHQTRPLLETLGFAIATVTLRIWYNARHSSSSSPTVTTNNYSSSSQQQRVGLVDMIVETFQTVWNVANSNSNSGCISNDATTTATASPTSSSTTTTMTFMAWLTALHATLGALPDVILGSPGGVRGRLSMDPQALYDAGQELRCHSSFAAVMSCWTNTIQQQLSSLQTVNNNNSINHNNIERHCHLSTLQTWEQWAKFLPLPIEFLEQSLPLVNHYLQLSSIDNNNTNNHHNSNHSLLEIKQCQTAAVAYLLAIFEGGTWNTEQILASTCGMTQNQLVQQAGKKKQTSRSKRRQEQVLQSRTTHASIQAAEAEVFHRGQVACCAVLGTHEGLHANFQAAMAQAATAANMTTGASTTIVVQGEGPIGCLAMAAQSCLPHLLRTSCLVVEQPQQTTTTAISDATNLFQSLAQVFQSICASPHPSVRVLSLEPLYGLHACLVQLVGAQPPTLQQKLEPCIESVLVEHFYICCMGLASSCGYPSTYFDNLAAISDEDLEIYRNDIRDLLRTVTCSLLEDSGNKSGTSSAVNVCPGNSQVTERILHKMLSACSETIQAQTVPPETAVHALSAMAKPLNSLAKSLATTRTTISNVDSTNTTAMAATSPLALETLTLALKCVVWTANSIVKAFQQQQQQHPATPMQALLPLSRTLNMAVASFAPMFSALCSRDELREAVSQVLTVSIQVAILSLRHLPELAAQSIKDDTQYDIRGTMRGPGGEDHVGSLVLMRLVFESNLLALAVAHAAVPHVAQLCEVYQYLKISESERGEAIIRGAATTTTIYTTPKSRRILLSALSRLELIAQGTLGASAMLTDMFHTAITSVCALNPQPHERGRELYYYSLCETTFDIAAFSSSIVRSLFEQAGDMLYTQCLERLTGAVLDGYKIAASTQCEPNNTILQWNRLRAALFTLIKSCASPDLPSRAVDMIQALVTAECQSIHEQFVAAGPMNATAASSVIFHPDVMGCEENTGVPAGLLIKCVNDAMEVSASERPPPMSSALNNGEVQEIHSLGRQPMAVSFPLSNCIAALDRCKGSVLSIVLLDFPSPVHDDDVDPRCTLMEAWLTAMINLVTVYKLRKGSNSNDDTRAEEILAESFVAGVVLLFYPTLNKTRCNDPGMSLDGPHSLALLNFFTIYLELGPTASTSSDGGGSMLERVAVQVATRMPAVTGIAATGVATAAFTNHPVTDASTRVGLALIGAAFFRAVQGAMPPWAVESVPSLYSALFVALGSDSSMFGLVLRDAMEIRLSNVQQQQQQFIVGVAPGQLFSGRFFENMSTTTKESFLQQTVELAHTANWRKLKQTIKAVCGGKKKETNFQQKPAFTKWEFDRI